MQCVVAVHQQYSAMTVQQQQQYRVSAVGRGQTLLWPVYDTTTVYNTSTVRHYGYLGGVR
jgi:hypothetical protein